METFPNPILYFLVGEEIHTARRLLCIIYAPKLWDINFKFKWSLKQTCRWKNIMNMVYWLYDEFTKVGFWDDPAVWTDLTVRRTKLTPLWSLMKGSFVKAATFMQVFWVPSCPWLMTVTNDTFQGTLDLSQQHVKRRHFACVTHIIQVGQETTIKYCTCCIQSITCVSYQKVGWNKPFIFSYLTMQIHWMSSSNSQFLVDWENKKLTDFKHTTIIANNCNKVYYIYAP